MTTGTIRAYRETDLDRVLDIWSDATRVAHPFLPEGFVRDERQQIRDVHMPNARTWVYESDGEVVGFIALVGNEIGGLFVDPDRHRHGIGRALVDTARAAHPTLEVEVFRNNVIGRSFYERYGFAVLREDTHEATGQAVLRLRFPPDQAG